MKQEVKIGQTDYSVLILIRDTNGAPKTGLVFNSAGIDVCYTRVETDNDVVLTDGAPVNLASPALTDPHLDWGFLQVDATKAPGMYRLDIADGVFAAGAWSAVVSLICTGCDPTHIEFILVPEAPITGVTLSTAQPAVVFTSLSVTGQLNAGNVLVDAGIAIIGSLAIGDGIAITCSTLNASAIAATGNGTGHGIEATSGGGATGNGISASSAATNGHGMSLTLAGTGKDLDADEIAAIKTVADAIQAVTDVESGVKAAVNALENLSAADVMDTVDALVGDLIDAWADGGRLDLLIDAIKAVTDVESGVKAAVDALNDPTAAVIADAVWDEEITGAAHNAANVAGRRLRQAADVMIIREETCQAGGAAGTLILDAGASGVDDFYANDIIILTSGAGSIQSRHIDSYDQGTKTCTVNRDWDDFAGDPPDATTKYIIRADSAKHVHGFDTTAKTEINVEVADVLKTDTKGEPAQGAPGATLSIEDKIAWMFKFMRNLITDDGTFIKVFNDAGAVVDHKAPVSEAAGTVTRGEFVTGP